MRILLICLCMVMGSHAAMAKSSVYRMMIGGRILELAQTRQLTNPSDGEVTSASISPDGKYVVYLSKHLGDNQACLTKLTSGRPIVFMYPPPNRDDEGFIDEVWTPYGDWAWSPDSRLFALFASHRVRGAKQTPWEFGIAVFNNAGARQAYFSVQGERQPRELLWSPDGHRLAGVFGSLHTRMGYKLLVFDLLSGSVEEIISQPTIDVHVVSWSNDGRSLHYVATPERKTQLREVNLTTREDKVIKEDYRPLRMPSPDGVFELDWGTGISIRNQSNGEVTELIKTKPDEVLGWAPNSKIIAYQKALVLKDESGKREQEFNALWLAAAEVNPFNHMCAALDAKKDSLPSWSEDCLKMAYISDGKLYVAEFAWKPITPYDKLDAGLPLTEKEEQEVLVDNARAIGQGIGMYRADWDGKYPSAEGFAEELEPYTRNDTLFFRPGTETIAFQYFPPGNQPGLANPASVVWGIFDIGYQWKVVLYADGHVAIVPK